LGGARLHDSEALARARTRWHEGLCQDLRGGKVGCVWPRIIWISVKEGQYRFRMTAEEVVFTTERSCMSIASIDRLFFNPRFKRRRGRKSRLPGLSLVWGAAVLRTLSSAILSVLTTLFPLCNRHLTISASMTRHHVFFLASFRASPFQELSCITSSCWNVRPRREMSEVL